MPSKSELRQKWNNAGKDVVVLHMFPRSRTSPNISPYMVKLETYLRVAGIDYINDFQQPTSSKGKSPWMTFNGRDMADSQHCIEHLGRTLNKDLSAHLSPVEKATARGMRAVLEDHFYFCLVMSNWVFGDLTFLRDEVFPPFPIPNFMVNLVLKRIRSKLKAQCEGQGIGRHSEEEIGAMGVQDLKAVSDFLGEKTFMMGDKPTELDCVVFGFVASKLFNSKDSDVFYRAIEEQFPNLKAHCLMMKEKYWPDWEECKYQPDRK